MSGRLPLFPLNLVLFPGAPLSLHIFEPRYRRMLADCLAGDSRFGIARNPDPEPGTVGCVARIRVAQPLPDGRSMIAVVGERRFIVSALLERDPYLMAAVEEFDDGPGTSPTPAERQRLGELADRYRKTLGILTDAAADQPAWEDNAAAFTWQVAALLEASLDDKEELLRLRSTQDRVRALTTLLPPLLGDLAERAAVHVKARANGRGGAHPDIITEG
jgi:Lon protease-like protein